MIRIQSFFLVLSFPLLLIIFSGCSHMPDAKIDKTNFSSDNKSTKLIIVNKTNILLFPFSNSINIAIDDKNLCNLDRNEYLEIGIEKGNHKLLLEHWDVVFIPSVHYLTIEKNLTILKAYSGVASTKYSFLNETESKVKEKYKKKICSNSEKSSQPITATD